MKYLFWIMLSFTFPLYSTIPLKQVCYNDTVWVQNNGSATLVIYRKYVPQDFLLPNDLAWMEEWHVWKRIPYRWGMGDTLLHNKRIPAFYQFIPTDSLGNTGCVKLLFTESQ